MWAKDRVIGEVAGRDSETVLLGDSLASLASVVLGGRDGQDTQTRWQALLAALQFAFLDLDIDVVRVFKLFLPFPAQLAETVPVPGFALVNSLRQFKISLGAEVLDRDSVSLQELPPEDGKLFQPL